VTEESYVNPVRIICDLRYTIH